MVSSTVVSLDFIIILGVIVALKFDTGNLYQPVTKKSGDKGPGKAIDPLYNDMTAVDTASPERYDSDAFNQAISDMDESGVDISTIVNPASQGAFTRPEVKSAYTDEQVARFQNMLTPTNIAEEVSVEELSKDMFKPVDTVAEGTKAPLDAGDSIGRSERFGALSPEAQFWGSIYQTTKNLDKMEKFDKDQGAYGSLDNEVGKNIQSASDVAGSVFDGDEGISGSKLANILKQTAAHESAGGKYDRQHGGGPAQGYWQVEPNTARDLIKNSSGYIGGKAKKVLSDALGKPVDLKNLSDKDLVTLLRTPVGGAVFGGWKYLAGSKAASIKAEADGDEFNPLNFLR